MATTVQVLCLNGRRQNVKINNNTTMLHVLEDVCKKQGFLPPSDYNLIHGRKVIDLTLPFRFSNLPNNVKLELIKAEKSREITNVHVALSVPNGERLENEFKPSTSLWEILTHWDDKLERPYPSHFARVDTSTTPHLHPVCIHMSEEVLSSYALQNTTLHHLGLTSGRALIRLTYRPVDDATLNQISESVDERKRHEAKLNESARSRTSSDNVAVACTTRSFLSPTHESAIDQEAMETTSYNVAADDVAAVTDGTRSDDSFHQVVVEKSNSVPSRDFHDLSPREQAIAARLAHRIMPQIGESSSSFNRPSSSHSQSPFSHFKFPEETKGQNLYHNKMQDVNLRDFRPCERDAVVFCIDDIPSGEQVTLPDDFFDVTEQDLRSMMDEQKKQLDRLENQPLMTKSMRILDMEQKCDKYKYAIVRIHFPDKHILQGRFMKKETVYALYKFVRENLEDNNQDFYLYVSPPKQAINDFAQTLVQARLVPAALIYFGCQHKQDHYLSSAVLKEVSSPIVAYSRASLSMTCSHDNMASDSVTSQTSMHRPKKDTGKVPKWFTAGKK